MKFHILAKRLYFKYLIVAIVVKIILIKKIYVFYVNKKNRNYSFDTIKK